MVRIAAALLALLMALAGSPVRAADHALLVGVGRYPLLPERLWLKGPANDVTLMRAALQAQGFPAAQVRVLSDTPTRVQILAAMQALTQVAQPGDRVLFYFSGHGSQQPQAPGVAPVEADGVDEVLLPADVQAWTGEGVRARIPNAIVDDEIGRWIDGLVDRGAQVWALFDTCHAAGMARGAGQVKVRALHPAELGLPDVRTSERTRSRLSQGRMDGRVLLFAGRAHERVREEWMPKGGSLAQTQMHGVFTWHLSQLLRARGLTDPAALIAALQQRYADERRALPVPSLAGELTPGKH